MTKAKMEEKIEQLEKLVRIQQHSLEILHRHLESMRPAVQGLTRIFLAAKVQQQSASGCGPAGKN